MEPLLLTLVVWLNAIQIAHYGTDAASTYWHVIATNNHYTNKRMTTETNFRQLYISKATPKIWAQMDCAKTCAADKKCLAFSFYEKETFYACDLAQDNYCTNQVGKALLHYNTSYVWDKINPGMTMGCYKPGPMPCENIRPGCKGNYPNCTDCIKTCYDCKLRYSYVRYRTCTLWPDGDGPDSEPIAVLCDNYFTTLVNRKINKTTGEILTDVTVPLENWSRLYRAYKTQYFRFYYGDEYGGYHSSKYRVQAMETNGTFTNMTFFADWDILKLIGRPPQTFHFATVTNDTYGCGSFWLFDPTNATYCPGGFVRMFGTPIFNGTKLITSGIRFGDIYPTYTFVEAGLFLIIY